MKKLLSIAFCAAAAFAASAETASTKLVTVGVIPVTLPAGQKNTIIAAAFTGIEGGELTIANVVKTTNLAQGDQILLFKDGGYTAWVLESDKKWAKTDTDFTIDSAGNTTITTGAETSTTLTAGQGLWIIRQDATSEANIAIYGKFIDAPKTTVAANTWTLIGNAGLKAFTTIPSAKGDKIITVSDGKLCTYAYNATQQKWYSQTVDNGNVAYTGWTPSLASGLGCWYYTTTEREISWTNVDAD